MKQLSVADRVRAVLDPKRDGVRARLFVTREDGITVYDTVQDNTTVSVSALVSGLWQASAALMGMVRRESDVMDFRLGFDSSEEGIFLCPFTISGKKYFLGAVYSGCLNPGLLKRQVTLVKEELGRLMFSEQDLENKVRAASTRDGYLFKDITDDEMDRLFNLGGH